MGAGVAAEAGVEAAVVARSPSVEGEKTRAPRVVRLAFWNERYHDP